MEQKQTGRFEGPTVRQPDGLSSDRFTTLPSRRPPVRVGNATFWAWTVSIALHLVVLTVFGVTRFSRPTEQGKQPPVPAARLSRIKKLMQAAPIIPKPKIRKPLPTTGRTRFAKRTDKILPANQILNTIKQKPQDSESFSKLPTSQKLFSLAGSTISPRGIEFFGSRTSQRKICYVVDCSGSMKGMFGRVRKELKESIANLRADQYFCIVFFGGDRLSEFGNGQLLRATQKIKSSAYDFINSIQPAGKTNAMAALQRAVQIRDGKGANPSMVYFLTDGFELTTEKPTSFARKISGLLKRFSPATKINTIGFWPQNNDREILELIAEQSNGEFVLITDDDS